MLGVGDTVGSYEVVALIGEGGVGIVYRVRHRILGTDHALKVLREERLASETVRDRFLAEARIQAQLAHPNILTVRDVVLEPGVAGLVMDLVQGRSLAEDIDARATPPSPSEVRQLFPPILEALGFAHERGVIHRDLKPANILLDRDPSGRVIPKVCDFGIAKLVGDLAGDARAKRSTVGDRALGTHGYMSPEQIRSAKDVDLRTDVFSIGATMFEYATGEVPFRGDSDFDLQLAAIEGRFEIPASLEDADPALADVLRRALQPDREARFSSCAELAAALAAVGRPTAPRIPVAARSTPPAPGRVVTSPSAGAVAGGILPHRIREWEDLEMLLIPAGEFTMGTNDPQAGAGGVRGVQLEAFYMARHPVTNGQYRKFVEATRRRPPAYWTDERFSDPLQPVIGVSWHDAVRFCSWLSRRTGHRYRLPSEEEWEKAARGTDGREYPWGKAAIRQGHHATFGHARETGKPTAAGSNPAGASPYGCEDMAGNVWEWTSSRMGTEKVARGGSWTLGAEFAHSAHRYSVDPSSKRIDFGFRCARDGGPRSLWRRVWPR